ncbi:MAG: DNA repair exonuclease [Firmicutes bacterium]|nr:DNA repair exonuclease [Bacillota bacterium]
MPTFRFIHTADLHLDSPFHGLGQVSEHLQTRIARAPLVALRRIVDACLEHRVHCLIIAGDFFDGGRVSLHTQAYVRSQLERLAKAGIVVAAAAGNHDPLSDGNFQLGWPENVIWFPADRVGEVEIPLEEGQVALVRGVSYGQRDVAEDLSELFPPADHDGWQVAVLHTSVEGLGGTENYSPTTRQALLDKGYRYWALGHVHGARILYQGPETTIAYSGSPQGLNRLERGEKGCYLVELGQEGVLDHRFLPCSDVVWEEVEVSISEVPTVEDLVEEVGHRLDELAARYEGRGVLAQVEINGRGPLHHWLRHDQAAEELLSLWQEQVETWESGFVFPHGVTINTRRDIDLEELERGQDFLAELLTVAEQLASHPQGEILQALEPLTAHRRARRYLEPLSQGEIKTLVTEGKLLALDRLLGDEK